MRIVGAVTEPGAVERILKHLGASPAAPRIAGPRAPPGDEETGGASSTSGPERRRQRFVLIRELRGAKLARVVLSGCRGPCFRPAGPAGPEKSAVGGVDGRGSIGRNPRLFFLYPRTARPIWAGRTCSDHSDRVCEVHIPYWLKNVFSTRAMSSGATTCPCPSSVCRSVWGMAAVIAFAARSKKSVGRPAIWRSVIGPSVVTRTD